MLNGFVKSNSLQTINARADDCFPPALMNNSGCQLWSLILSTEGSSEESGLLKVTVVMSLIFEQDVLIIPQKQLCLEANQTLLRLLPPPAFLSPFCYFWWCYSFWVSLVKLRNVINALGQVEGKWWEKQTAFLFPLFLFLNSFISPVLVLLCMLALCKHLNEHVHWQKYSGIQGMIRLEY